jgi:SAM-dependent methyltransferase
MVESLDLGDKECRMQHTELVYNLIGENDNVLDVGGAYQPFFRADSVIDILPFENANMSNVVFRNPSPPRFSKESWHVQDINDSKKPWPFKDKQFDFCLCTHVLEDLRDPIYVVSEITRVAKRGYIEVPSRYQEQTVGLELQGICGYGHHRWIIDTDDNKIRLIFKCHELHSPTHASKWHISHGNGINRNYRNLGIFWEGDVECFEKNDIDLSFTRNYLKETVEKAKSLPNFHDHMAPISATTIKKNPFINDGRAHVCEYMY